MNKKIVIGAIIVIILAVGYYLVSPLWRNVELNEASPLSQPAVQDNLETMDAESKAKFNMEVRAVQDEIVVKEDPMPDAPRLLAQGSFIPRAHDVSGKVLLIEKDGQTVLRFEDFETINGPDMVIYLASDLSERDVVSLGSMRATKGNVNYMVPAGTNLAKYNRVLVWCKAFGVLFSYAELK